MIEKLHFVIESYSSRYSADLLYLIKMFIEP